MTEVCCLCVSGQVTIKTTPDRTFILQIDKAPNETLSIELAGNEAAQVMYFLGHVLHWRNQNGGID